MLLRIALVLAAALVAVLLIFPQAHAEDAPSRWPALTSTFPSTGGGGFVIKGYDPVISGGKCLTTFIAVEPGPDPKVYPNFIEYEAVARDGGILCTNGKWRAFEGGASGTTPFRMFFKDGQWRMSV